MTTSTVVDRLYDEFSYLLKFISEAGEISLYNLVEDHSRKSLLLCAASYFEFHLCETVVGICTEHSGSNDLLVSIIKNKAVSRQYHTWFDWDGLKFGPFFGLFGSDFKSYCVGLINSDAEKKSISTSFVEIGRDRNRLVHQNYGSFTLEKTVEEIYSLYKTGEKFPGLFSELFKQYLADGVDKKKSQGA